MQGGVAVKGPCNKWSGRFQGIGQGGEGAEICRPVRLRADMLQNAPDPDTA